MPAIGQESSQNIEKSQPSEISERQRIKLERAAATQELAQQREACYQKLAVTPCLNVARDAHNEKVRDLKRQEVALSDVLRKRAAADRLRALDTRNSPEAQLAQAQRRGKALESARRREESFAVRQSRREAKQAAVALPSDAKTADATLMQPQMPQQARQAPAKKLALQQRPREGTKIEKTRQQAADREKATEMRRAQALNREAKRKKPAAAPLPIPL